MVIGATGLALALQESPGKGPPLKEQPGAPPLSEIKIIERVTAATDKALDYIESKQNQQQGADKVDASGHTKK